MITGMKRIMLRTLMMVTLSPAVLLADEQLLDRAPPDDQARQTREKGPNQALNSEELESLYLQSPVELDTTDESQGLNALSSDSRYLESDQELLQRQRDTVQIIPTPEEATPPTPPTLIPVRDL